MRDLLYGFPASRRALEETMRQCPILAQRRRTAIDILRRLIVITALCAVVAYYTNLVLMVAVLIICGLLVVLAGWRIRECNQALYSAYAITQINLEERANWLQ